MSGKSPGIGDSFELACARRLIVDAIVDLHLGNKAQDRLLLIQRQAALEAARLTPADIIVTTEKGAQRWYSCKKGLGPGTKPVVADLQAMLEDLSMRAGTHRQQDGDRYVFAIGRPVTADRAWTRWRKAIEERRYEDVVDGWLKKVSGERRDKQALARRLEIVIWSSDSDDPRERLVALRLVDSDRDARALLQRIEEHLKPSPSGGFPPIHIDDLYSQLKDDGPIRHAMVQLRRDVQRFQQLHRPAPTACLRDDHPEWRIHRPGLVEELTDLAAEGHLLVAGDAGVGKSALLGNWLERLDGQPGSKCCRIEADELAAADVAQHVFRPTSGKTPREMLEAWSAQGVAYLVIDGLDEILTPSTRKLAKDLMNLARHSRGVRLVMACRTADLAAWQGPLGQELRVLRVPPLNDDEVDQLAATLPKDIATILRDPSRPRLRALARNLFLLRIIVEVALQPGGLERMCRSQSDTDVLCEFWDATLLARDRDQGTELDRGAMDLAARLATRTCDSLAPGQMDLASASARDLRSIGVFAADPTTLRFQSRILRDFATARSFWQDDPARGRAWLREHPEGALVLRHWLGIAAWYDARGHSESGLATTWKKLLQPNDLPDAMRCDAAEWLARDDDQALAARFVDWNEFLPIRARRLVQQRVLVATVERMKTVHANPDIGVALASAAAALDDEFLWFDCVEMLRTAIEMEGEDSARHAQAVLAVIDRLANSRRLSESERERRLGRLLGAAIQALRGRADDLERLVDSVSRGSSDLIPDVIDELPYLATLQPDLATRAFTQCALRLMSDADHTGWHAYFEGTNVADKLLDRDPAGMTSAILHILARQAEHEDAQHGQGLLRVAEAMEAHGLGSAAEIVRESPAASALSITSGWSLMEDRSWSWAHRAIRHHSNVLHLLEDLKRAWKRWAREPASDKLRLSLAALRSNARHALPAAAMLETTTEILDAGREARAGSGLPGSLLTYAVELLSAAEVAQMPSMVEAARGALLAMCSIDACRAEGKRIAGQLMEDSAYDVVAVLRTCADPTACVLGEEAAERSGYVGSARRNRGLSLDAPSVSDQVRHADEARGVNRSTSAYQATFEQRVWLRKHPGDCTASVLDELPGRLHDMHATWQKLVVAEDRPLRASIERDMAQVVDRLAERWAQTEGHPALRAWMRTFSADHSQSVDPQPDAQDVELSSVSSAVRACCARTLLWFAWHEGLTEPEAGVVERLAEDPAAAVRVEVARKVSHLHKNHRELMWSIAMGMAGREHGAQGAAVVNWLLAGINSWQPDADAASLLDLVWRRRHWLPTSRPLERPGLHAIRIAARVWQQQHTAVRRFLDRVLAEDDLDALGAVALGSVEALESALEADPAEAASVAALERAAAMASHCLHIAYQRLLDIDDPSRPGLEAIVQSVLSGVARVVEDGSDALRRIPAELWRGLLVASGDRPVFSSELIGTFLHVARRVARFDAPRGMELAELAILRPDGALLGRVPGRGAGYLTSRLLKICDVWLASRGLTQESARRALPLVDAVGRFHIPEATALRERLLRAIED